MDCSLPGSSVHDILQASILEWVAMPSSRDLPDPGLEPASPALAGRFSTAEPPGKEGLLLILAEALFLHLQGEVRGFLVRRS